MRTRTLLAIALAVFAASASAQAYKWVDRNGRMQYGDTPPPGVNATALGAPSTRLDPEPQAKPEAKKGPLTPAEQEAAFRKRQEEAEKGRQKQAQAAEQAAAKKENCALAQNQLRTLQSGMRISRTDAKGERYFLDEAQIAQETAKTQQAVQQWCG
jgi:hypothetical protein